MTEWLVVTLAAPLASFGEEAGNVRRSTADRPTRSALLGIAGAALGIERSDANRQRDLFASFRVATRTLRNGTLVVDFHTYQSLPSTKEQARTRADALAHQRRLNTSITKREYRSDVHYQAAYRTNSGATYTLEDLHAAFKRPIYTLYLGRRSCPLSRPLAPEIVHARTAAEAFIRHRDAPKWFRQSVVAVEDRQDLGDSDAMLRARLRVDDPGDRSTWQFSPRWEYSRALTGDAENESEEVSE